MERDNSNVLIGVARGQGRRQPLKSGVDTGI